MKTILLFIGLALNFIVNAQWKYETINNGFDDPYKIAYTSENNNAVLKLENVDGDVCFYLQGGYHCDETPEVDLLFMVNGSSKRYTITGSISENKKCVFFTFYLLSSDFLEDFKNCSSLRIRVNESVCTNDLYNFNMTNSTAAFNYIK
jgi:hypothetical protein